MRRSRTLYATAYDPPRQYPCLLTIDEKLAHKVDWSGYVGQTGGTISTSAWESKDTGVATVASDALAPNVASAVFTGVGRGKTRVRNTVTMSDGQVVSRDFHVEVLR